MTMGRDVSDEAMELAERVFRGSPNVRLVANLLQEVIDQRSAASRSQVLALAALNCLAQGCRPQCLAADLGQTTAECGIGAAACLACKAGAQYAVARALANMLGREVAALEKTSMRMLLEPERKRIAAELRDLIEDADGHGTGAREIFGSLEAFAAKLEKGL